jgi:hypothetical protein
MIFFSREVLISRKNRRKTARFFTKFRKIHQINFACFVLGSQRDFD